MEAVMGETEEFKVHVGEKKKLENDSVYACDFADVEIDVSEKPHLLHIYLQINAMKTLR